MSQEQQLATFEGYAIVEIMGHQRVAGYVTTQYFGSTAVFRVVQQEQPPEEIVLESDQWIDGERIYAGSKVRFSRPRAETFVASASLYRMTPCSEDQANRDQPKVVEVVERAKRKVIAAPDIADALLDDADDGDYGDDPYETDRDLGGK